MTVLDTRQGMTVMKRRMERLSKKHAKEGGRYRAVLLRIYWPAESVRI